MKTLLSGNAAVAIFNHVNEQGRQYSRLHIYNKQNQEWVYNSFILVKSDEPGFNIHDVEISGSRAILHVHSRYFEGQVIFYKKGDSWEYQRRIPAAGAETGFKMHGRTWVQRLYHFFGLPGAVSLPAAQ